MSRRIGQAWARSGSSNALIFSTGGLKQVASAESFDINSDDDGHLGCVTARINFDAAWCPGVTLAGMGRRGGGPRPPRSRRWRTVLGYGVFGLFSTVAAGLLVVFAVFTVTNVLVWRHLLGHLVTVRVDACGNAGCAGREVAGPELGTYVRNLPHDRPAGSAVRAWEWGGDAVVGVPWGSFVGAVIACIVLVLLAGAAVSTGVRRYRPR